MAQYNEDPLRRTDANEIRFQETVPDDKKYAATKEGAIQSLPKGGQDVGIHIDKPTSVTETGYGGISGRGNDISAKIDEARGHSPLPDRPQEGGKSLTEKAKDVAHGVKDLATSKKQEEASAPVVDQGSRHERKEGVGEKVRDIMTGQTPGHGTGTTEGSGDWPSATNAATESATYTDARGCAVEGPRDDDTKKEGVMSKVMDKFNLSTDKK